jgi:hypothetical protein
MGRPRSCSRWGIYCVAGINTKSVSLNMKLFCENGMHYRPATSRFCVVITFEELLLPPKILFFSFLFGSVNYEIFLQGAWNMEWLSTMHFVSGIMLQVRIMTVSLHGLHLT